MTTAELPDDEVDVRAEKLSWGITNTKLKKTGPRPGAAAFSLPAGRIEEGGSCPGASKACLAFCYARTSHYLTPKVMRPRQYNLAVVRDSISDFIELACWDLERSSLLQPYQVIRLHDSGDFFSKEYFVAWTKIARRISNRTFYAYSKSVTLIAWTELPDNMIVVQSFDEETTAPHINWDKPVAKVFRTIDDLLKNTEGFIDSTNDDNAVLQGHKRIGLAYHPEDRVKTTYDPATQKIGE